MPHYHAVLVCKVCKAPLKCKGCFNLQPSATMLQLKCMLNDQMASAPDNLCYVQKSTIFHAHLMQQMVRCAWCVILSSTISVMSCKTMNALHRRLSKSVCCMPIFKQLLHLTLLYDGQLFTPLPGTTINTFAVTRGQTTWISLQAISMLQTNYF